MQKGLQEPLDDCLRPALQMVEQPTRRAMRSLEADSAKEKQRQSAFLSAFSALSLFSLYELSFSASHLLPIRANLSS
jgi:hypothetical protein